MRISRFEVVGLMGRESPLQLTFNDDLNIVTGRNGSGKTSLLKLLWYIVSGNILQALREVDFRRATLETTEYVCTIHRLSPTTCRVDWEEPSGSQTFEDITDQDGNVEINAEDEANERLRERGSSVFLPTFRRIEGGFTLTNRTVGLRSGLNTSRAKNEIEDALVTLSTRLSHGAHVFVAALSTVDVVNLLVRQYTDLSEQYTRLQQEQSQDVIAKIRAYKRDTTESDSLRSANQLLDEIRAQIEGVEGTRETIMRPVNAVTGLAMKLFRHAGIQLGKTLRFGDAANAVNSDVLSSGEKQMLSFIAYNAFYEDAVFFIDEPELSLHVDWQRQLFPILMEQQASNQFVVATHSPFIYSKYPDKELQIDPERGDEAN